MLQLSRWKRCGLQNVVTNFERRVTQPFNTTEKRCFATKPYPMRSGYGLGSVVPPKLIAGMRREANIRSDIIQMEDLLDDLEATERELVIEKNGLVNEVDNSQTLVQTKSTTVHVDHAITRINRERGKLLRKKLTLYDDLIKLQLETTRDRRHHETAADPDDKHNDFNSFFASAIEAPINWQKSKVDYIDRSFDSIQVNAQFFDKNTLHQGSDSHAKNIATGVAKGVKNLGRNSSSRVSASVHNAVSRTQEVHNIESTLLVIAYATHKYVKQFNPLVLDADKLYMAWNYMHPESPISLTQVGAEAALDVVAEDDGDDDAISVSTAEVLETASDVGTKTKDKDKSGKKRYLHIISEEFLGSAMVGMMHFLKTSETTTTQLSHAADLKMELMKRITALGSVAGNTGLPQQFAEKFAQNLSTTGIDTVFDMVVEGYFPKLESTAVESSLKEFKNFSPDRMQVSTDKTFWKDMNKSQNQLLRSNKKQALKESHSGAMIRATIAGLHEAYVNKHTVLDYQSFMNAFHDYVKNGVNKPGVGVPIGINVKQLTKEEIRAIVARKWDPKSVHETGFGSGMLTGKAGNIGKGGFIGADDVLPGPWSKDDEDYGDDDYDDDYDDEYDDEEGYDDEYDDEGYDDEYGDEEYDDEYEEY